MLVFFATLFLIIFLRYFLLAGLYDWWTRWLLKTGKRPINRQFLRELKWSLFSSGIFAVLSVFAFYLYQKGYTRIYIDIAERGVIYFAASIALYMLFYETYYYWLHRWMHRPRVFRIVHKVHHESVDTSAFTSFSFHPIEALLQFIFLPVMVLIFPIHYWALGIILMLMTASAIINHAGVEIYPRQFYRHRLGRWLIGSSHHEVHHKEFRSNYGLYFTFWDKWMNTESKRYHAHFDRKNLSQFQSQHHPSADARHR